MVKKISTLALAGLLALPAMAAAGAGSTSDMQSQIDALTKQLEALKAQMGNMKAAPAAAMPADLTDRVSALEDKSEAWDFASRIQLGGDFRARGDYYSADTKSYVPMLIQNAAGQYVFNDPTGPYYTAPASEKENDSIFTNRFRLDMRAKALENVEFKGRLAMYKTWGEQTLASGMGNQMGFPLDSVATREPKDSILRVDRAFVNWNNIGGAPVWFSVGRRPTTDGPPNNLRMNSDERMATPTAYMDWPFDGVSVGYAYNNLFGQQDMPGRVRVCWGRGFEDGITSDTTNNIDDTDFAGVSWDVYKKGDRFVYLQSFAAMGVFNYPRSADGSMEYMMGALGLLSQTPAVDLADYTYPELVNMGNAGRTNIGNIYHTSGVYMDKWENLNYFASLGWSATDPDGGEDMLGETDGKDGYAVHVGVRYDIPDSLFKVGAEYNHGSKYWVSMSPGHDDLYASKLATRGNVYEVYGIYDIPGGEAVSKLGKAWMRLGYQHYDYNYTGSGDWTMMPIDIDSNDLLSPMNMQLSAPVESADQVYLTFEAAF